MSTCRIRRMTRVMLLLAALLLSLPRAFAADYQNLETGYRAVVEDDAGLLTEEQESLLLEKMEPVTAYGNALFKTISSNSTSTSRFAEQYYHESFGNGTSGTLFLIDMKNRELYIFSDGAVYQTVTKAKAETITDNVYQRASRGEYYSCAWEAFSEIAIILDGGRIAEPMRYIDNALLAIILALLANFILVTMLTRARRASNAQLLQVMNVSVDGGDPVGREIGTTRSYSPVSTSSGGGGGGGGFSGGGGGGGGGGSSGGGGGHSF